MKIDKLDKPGKLGKPTIRYSRTVHWEQILALSVVIVPLFVAVLWILLSLMQADRWTS